MQRKGDDTALGAARVQGSTRQPLGKTARTDPSAHPRCRICRHHWPTGLWRIPLPYPDGYRGRANAPRASLEGDPVACSGVLQGLPAPVPQGRPRGTSIRDGRLHRGPQRRQCGRTREPPEYNRGIRVCPWARRPSLHWARTAVRTAGRRQGDTETDIRIPKLLWRLVAMDPCRTNPDRGPAGPGADRLQPRPPTGSMPVWCTPAARAGRVPTSPSNSGMRVPASTGSGRPWTTWKATSPRWPPTMCCSSW